MVAVSLKNGDVGCWGVCCVFVVVGWVGVLFVCLFLVVFILEGLSERGVVGGLWGGVF
eukprot:COSAG01_NODE_66500_length_270_cov_0.549708_1_plen_58_part_00